MSAAPRPRTAVDGRQQLGLETRDLGGGGTARLMARRPGSQMSLRSSGGARADDSCWPQYVPIRRVPSSMKRSIEIQTELMNQHQQQQQQLAPADQQGTGAPVSGSGLFYPYYVPGLQDPQLQPPQQQPFILLSPWQLPGYQSLPVLDASQLKLLDPAGRHPLDGPTPVYRSGRNGSCWRHIKQCTGNLGNNIMFVDGHVKEEDCRRFPPHGYPSGSAAGLSVHNRLAPKSQPRLGVAGIPLGYPGTRQQLPVGGLQSQALERARSGTKYWYEDRKQAQLVPNTIQGRIMKSGSAY